MKIDADRAPMLEIGGSATHDHTASVFIDLFKDDVHLAVSEVNALRLEDLRDLSRRGTKSLERRLKMWPSLSDFFRRNPRKLYCLKAVL